MTETPWEKHERDTDEDLRSIKAEDAASERQMLRDLFVHYVSFKDFDASAAAAQANTDLAIFKRKCRV